MTEPGPWGSTPPPPPEPWGPTAPPPPNPPGYGQQWGAPPPPPGYYPPPMYPPPRQTNAMAITALVCAFFFPPLAIVFGHIALSQIRRTGEEGKGLAVAGLVIGYVVTGLIVLYIVFMVILFAWIKNSVDNSTYNSIWTTTTTSYPYETNEQAIKNARIGQCVHMEDNGSGTISTIYRTDCKSSNTTHRVTKVTTTISACTDDWARSADKTVVLCLAQE
jgi:large-conductance mechanosensitive channel